MCFFFVKIDHETPPAKQVAEKVNTDQNAHRKLEKQLVAEVSDVREQLLEVNVMDGFTEQPSGAFISLTLGLFLVYPTPTLEKLLLFFF